MKQRKQMRAFDDMLADAFYSKEAAEDRDDGPEEV